ncbi:hypothetical protein MauCBS54593_001139 [Microsporum audouinii]
MPPSLPESYAALPTEHIKLSHVPPSSSTPTPVLLLTLNRPEKLNAYTELMSKEIASVLGMVDIDDRVKVIVLTGSGKKAFCAGADLDIGFGGMGKGGAAAREKDHRDGGGRISLAIHNCRKPTIVAINGSAVGVGITMTLPATIRLVTAEAKIGFVFSRRGLIMEAVSSFFLPRLIGYSRALHITTTGSTYPAGHPLLKDLFSEILSTPEATVARALELADDIALNTSTISTSLMRDLMYRGPDSAEATHLLDSSLIYPLFGNKDNEEGVKSFFEKRSPQFKGSFNNPNDVPAAYPWWKQVDVSPPKLNSKL